MNSKNYQALKKYFFSDDIKCKNYIFFNNIFINNIEKFNKNIKVLTDFSNMDSLFVFMDDENSIADASKTLKCLSSSSKSGSIMIKDKNIVVEDIGIDEYKRIEEHTYTEFYIEYKNEIYLFKVEKEFLKDKITNSELLYVGEATIELKEEINNKETNIKEHKKLANETLEELKSFLNGSFIIEHKNETMENNDYERIKRYFLGTNKYFIVTKIFNTVCYASNMCQMPNQATLFNVTTNTCFLNDINSIENASSELEYLFWDFDSNYYYIFVKYKNKAYRIAFERDNNKFFAKNVELIYEPNGKEGRQVLYDSNNDGNKENWIVLYDDGKNIDIVSEEIIGNLELGLNSYQDPTNEEIKQNNIDIYNNLIDIINNYCKEVITVEENKNKIRSVGIAKDITNQYYKSELLESKYNNLLKEGDRFYEQDMVRMNFWKVGLNTENRLYYIASRYCGSATRAVGFEMNEALASFNARIVNSDGNNEYYGLIGDDTMLVEIWDKGIGTFEQHAGVRPIIKNPTKYELA